MPGKTCWVFLVPVMDSYLLINAQRKFKITDHSILIYGDFWARLFTIHRMFRTVISFDKEINLLISNLQINIYLCALRKKYSGGKVAGSIRINKMSIEKALKERSGSVCELCGNTEGLTVYALPPVTENNSDKCVLLCSTCNSRIEEPETMDASHWRCLNDSMWSTVPAVQVLAWRILNQLKHEGWPQDLLDMLYLDDETLAWARSGLAEDGVKHVDSNGAVLKAGDTVVLIKDLNVKGAGFTAKRGTAVRNISLVADNPDHIEGKVNGQQIVILTQYVKKSN